MSSSQAPALDAHRIADLPESGFYFPDFITEEQETYILQEIGKLPLTRWNVLSHRRLLSLPSQLTGTTRDTLIASSLPTFLTKNITDKIEALGVFRDTPHCGPNHCLVNEYQPGQGIMPHEDGPAYYPITATISLASHTILDIYEKNEKGEREATPTSRVLQEPRSLLITTGDMYQYTLHGISEVEKDEDLGPETIVNWSLLGDQATFSGGTAHRGTRISLTYRDVLKVAKVGGALKFMSKK